MVMTFNVQPVKCTRTEMNVLRWSRFLIFSSGIDFLDKVKE